MTTDQIKVNEVTNLIYDIFKEKDREKQEQLIREFYFNEIEVNKYSKVLYFNPFFKYENTYCFIIVFEKSDAKHWISNKLSDNFSYNPTSFDYLLIDGKTIDTYYFSFTPYEGEEENIKAILKNLNQLKVKAEFISNKIKTITSLRGLQIFIREIFNQPFYEQLCDSFWS